MTAELSRTRSFSDLPNLMSGVTHAMHGLLGHSGTKDLGLIVRYVTNFFETPLKEQEALELVQALIDFFSVVKDPNSTDSLVDERLEALRKMRFFADGKVYASELIAWMLQALLNEQSESPSKLFTRSLMLLIQKAPFEERWLKRLIPIDQPGFMTGRMFDECSAALNDQNALFQCNFRRLKALVFEECGLQDYEKLCMSLFCAFAKGLPITYARKVEYGLPRSVHRTSHGVFIRLRESVSLGIYKCLYLPFDENKPVQFGHHLHIDNDDSFTPMRNWQHFHSANYTKGTVGKTSIVALLKLV